MPIYGEFGERTPEEIKHLQRAMNNLGATTRTLQQFNTFVNQQDVDLPEDASDPIRLNHFVNTHPRYEPVIRAEYAAMLLAVDALAKYFAAEKATSIVRQELEHDAADILTEANVLADSPDVSYTDFLPPTT